LLSYVSGEERLKFRKGSKPVVQLLGDQLNNCSKGLVSALRQR